MQKTRSDYKICPFCGASLDVGESCDCRQEKQPPELTQAGLLRGREYKTPSRPQKRLERALRRF